MEKIWNELYKSAKNKLNSKEISPLISFGNTSCAIQGENNKIYTGVSVNSITSIDSSAEKNALVSMINDGEYILKKIVILNELEEVIIPSEEYFNYLLEFNFNIDDIEVLINYEKQEIKKISSLLPDWWGTYHIKNESDKIGS